MQVFKSAGIVPGLKTKKMIKSIARKEIFKIKPYVPGKPIKEVQREMGIKDVVKMASNESPFAPSPGVLKAMKDEAKKLNRYPLGDCYYLRKALAKEIGVDSRRIVFGNGSDELITMINRALIEKGDEVIVAHPSFLMYRISSAIAGARLKIIGLKDFRYDLKSMRGAVTKRTKIIFIGNPDNPAGTYVNQTQVCQFLKGLPKNILVVFDEAYYEFAKDSPDYPDSIALQKTCKNIVTLRTFSKIYGLAGLRIGYAIGSPEVSDILERVRGPFNVNSPAQAAALACLREQSYYRKKLSVLKKERKNLFQKLTAMGLSCVQTTTNFMLVDVKKNSTQVVDQLMRKGVIVRDMKGWGMRTYIRASVGTTKENRKLLSALKETLR